MSSAQSERNGNSVEPGLPNTFLMPNARNRSSVACLTVTDLVLAWVFSRAKASHSLRDGVCFTSPIGRGRRVAPGEGLRTKDRPYPLTPALSPWEREQTSVDASLVPLTTSRWPSWSAD